jgi:hypothetical protein
MMIQTSTQTLMEMGKQIPESLDIELCSCDSLKSCGIDYLEQFASEKRKRICEVFKNNSQFYYCVIKRTKDQILSYEVGICKILYKNKKATLKRKQCFYCSKDGEVIHPDNSVLLDFTCYEGEFLTVSQYVPRSYLELLCESNSIIASNEAYSPMTVDIQKNSIIGRLDGTIQSIPITTLLSQIIKYNEEEERVEFFNGQKWIGLK